MWSASVVQTKRAVCRVSRSDGLRVHTVAVQPRPVLVEVGAGGAHQDRVRAELSHAEGDVGPDTAPAYVEVVHEEGEGDRVQLVRDELVGEAAGKVIRWSAAMEPVTAIRTA